MGVVTESELKEKKKKAEGSKTPSASKKDTPEKKPEISYKYECLMAPAGKSKIAFNHMYEGKRYKYSFALDNKVYTIPENTKEEDRKRISKALIDNGFINVSKSSYKPVFNKDTSQWVYKAVHPEHCERNRINGTIALKILDKNGELVFTKEGKPKITQPRIIDGVIETDDELEYLAAIRAGFMDYGKREVKDES
jgi:hypothetical protein